MCSGFRPFGPVLRPSLATVIHACGIERPPNHVVPHPRKILHPTATDQHDRVFLEVVADARDIRRNLHPVRQSHTRDFPQRRIGFLGRLRINANANATFLRAVLKGRAGGFVSRRSPSSMNELAKRWHPEFSGTSACQLPVVSYQFFTDDSTEYRELPSY